MNKLIIFLAICRRLAAGTLHTQFTQRSETLRINHLDYDTNFISVVRILLDHNNLGLEDIYIFGEESKSKLYETGPWSS
ncbi:hypothetical protein QQ020_17120 [Fulvivirgaceae bacterium BMA12]|uniref:Uncharacterized protein n=1 Tax=Agaribacillus aureus TaxID=3051825 RepID=A0ABT8LBY1_9BACT|nr:hypothetical protein [Fulvivirgaceae bacterium BMA12]